MEVGVIQAISIHALVKRATLYFKYFILYNIISIHALVKRATKGSHSSLCNGGNFNPRPRKEGDGATRRGSYHGRISIHALVKRATKGESRSSQLCFISIHALVKRATRLSGLVAFTITISIHALVKRAT